jgi:hypothetical protein
VLGHKANLVVISRIKTVLVDEDLNLGELAHVKSNPAFSFALCCSDGYMNINHWLRVRPTKAVQQHLEKLTLSVTRLHGRMRGE